MPENLLITLPSDFSFEMIFVEGGEFRMGDEVGDLGDDARPVHAVRVSSFYIAKYPVTQRLWSEIIKDDPSDFKGENRPVESVTWEETQQYIKKLNHQKWKGKPDIRGTFRLPTEAEWEYAARGGKNALGYRYAGSDRLHQVGWYGENSRLETREVGLLLGNELGIHDLSGNVWEWCEDWYGEDYYKKCQRKGLVENPQGPREGSNRVLRGGCFWLVAPNCRLVLRYRLSPVLRNVNYGFRLVLSPQVSGN